MPMHKKKMKGRGVSTIDVKNVKDALARSLADNLNKQFKDFRVAHFLDGSDEAPTQVTEWISTGDDILDLRISNRPNGGIPVGKITEIFGAEASGKSLLLAQMIVETQKKGGIAVLIDTEASAQTEFLQAIGVDLTNLLYLQIDTLEDVFASVESIITNVREKNRDRLVFIGIDSIAGASTKLEMEQDFDKEGWATAKAIIMSKATRKITNLISRQRIALVCTNQVRDKLGVMFGDKVTTSGGKALGFHASVRIYLQGAGQIKSGTDTVGVKSKATVRKNRVGPPLRKCELDIYFNRGVDRYAGWMNALKSQGLATVTGGRAPSVKIDDLKLDIPIKKWHETLQSDADVRNSIYQLLCGALIMKYRGDTSELEDVTISNEVVDE